MRPCRTKHCQIGQKPILGLKRNTAYQPCATPTFSQAFPFSNRSVVPHPQPLFGPIMPGVRWTTEPQRQLFHDHLDNYHTAVRGGKKQILRFFDMFTRLWLSSYPIKDELVQGGKLASHVLDEGYTMTTAESTLYKKAITSRKKVSRVWLALRRTKTHSSVTLYLANQNTLPLSPQGAVRGAGRCSRPEPPEECHNRCKGLRGQAASS